MHLSSGTTGVAGGPVQILRSPLTILLMRRVNGGLITWSLGRSSTGGLCMLQMAPEMTDSVTFASFAADVLHELDSEIVFGNSLRPAGNDENIWRRLEPDMHTMRSFFASKVEPKLLVTGQRRTVRHSSEPECGTTPCNQAGPWRAACRAWRRRGAHDRRWAQTGAGSVLKHA